MSTTEKPGVEFEKVVASIQARFDPHSKVTHNAMLVDRLGHRRQFDVTISGNFAGQDVLAVIECKDLARPVGTPEVDAFVTKANDVNANIKLLVSRRGFTKPAVQKCAAYGIQALSLADGKSSPGLVGSHWQADVSHWARISITLGLESDAGLPLDFDATEVRIEQTKLVDWFNNYLIDHGASYEGEGWVGILTLEFDNPQTVSIGNGRQVRCTAIGFQAERVVEKLERFVPATGDGFVNWNTKQATFPPNTEIIGEPVPMDFSQWKPRGELPRPNSGWIELRIVAERVQERIPGLLDLGCL